MKKRVISASKSTPRSLLSERTQQARLSIRLTYRCLVVILILLSVILSLIYIRTHHALMAVPSDVEVGGRSSSFLTPTAPRASNTSSKSSPSQSQSQPYPRETRRNVTTLSPKEVRQFIRSRNRLSLSGSSYSEYDIGNYSVEDEPVINFTVSSTDTSHSPPWAVFYNIYIPKTTTAYKKRTSFMSTTTNQFVSNITYAMEIIREQLGQIGSSYAANYFNDDDDNHEDRDGIKPEKKSTSKLRVYYNTIGEPLNETLINDVICRDENSLHCVHMNHYDHAFEERTLRRVYEYCQANPDNRVTYMHSKGSYHDRNGRNSPWRRHMTYAVTHKDCMVPPDDTCDICGLNFYAEPWIHFSGNFFTARCRYVNKLLPVHEFIQKMSTLHDKTNLYEDQERFVFWIFKNQPSYMALGRYASEAWSGSHPSVVPCDLSEVRNIDFWKKEPFSQEIIEANFNFSLAPRATDARGKFLHIRRTKRNKLTLMIREYYLLAGNLFKWIHLYNGEVPARNSWVWDFFPNGDIWWEGYETYGDEVVEGVIDPFAMANGSLSQWPDEVRKWREREERREQREKLRNATREPRFSTLENLEEHWSQQKLLGLV